MTRAMVGLLAAGAVGLAGVTGCGSGDGPPAASGSSSASATSSASASASSTGTPSSGVPAEATKRATSATKKALLPASAFAKIGLDVDDKPETTRWDWFYTCRPTLPSESRQVIGTNGQWSKDGLVVSQTVVAYPDGVAEDIVGEVAKAVSCATYTSDGKEYGKVKAVALPALDSADGGHAWCEELLGEDVTICTSVIASQDLVSSLWAMSGDAGDAKEAMAALTLLAAARIQAQAG